MEQKPVLLFKSQENNIAMNKIDELIFEPRCKFMSAGNEHQRSVTHYKGIEIMEMVIFPWNIFKSPSFLYVVDLIIPNNTVIQNGIINSDMYTDEGFGYPQFEELEHAVEYIDKFKENERN